MRLRNRLQKDLVMYLNRKNIFYALAIIFLIVGCKKSPVFKNSEKINYRAGRPSLKVVATDGDGQTVMPSLIFPKPLKFRVEDDSGKTYEGVQLELFLVDISDASEVTKALLLSAALTNAESLGVTNWQELPHHSGKSTEQIKGSISKTEFESDADGEISFKVNSSKLPKKEIAVVALIKGSTEESKLAFISVRTDEHADPVAFKITTTNGQSELAGESFTMSVTAYDASESIATELNGLLTLSMSTNANKAWLDLPGASLPAATIDCEFTEGVCTLPNAITFSKAEDVAIMVSESTYQINAKQIVSVKNGAATYLVLATNPTGNSSDEIVGDVIIAKATTDVPIFTQSFVVSSDVESIEYSPSLVDKGGNFISVAASNWNVSGPFAGQLTGASVTGKQTVTPLTAGTGVMNVEAGGISGSFNYEITIGKPHHVEVELDDPSDKGAGTPFLFGVSIRDLKGNICTGFDGNIALVFSALDSTDTVEGNGLLLPADDTYPFVQGVMVSSLSAIFYNSLETPKVEVTHALASSSISGASSPVTVLDDVFHHYSFELPTMNETVLEFAATLDKRDEWGNQVSTGGDTGLNLTVVKSDDSAPTGTLSENGGFDLTNIDMTGSAVVVPRLTFNASGLHKLRLEKPLTTVLGVSPTIEFEATILSIDHYNLVFSTITPTAGVPFTVTATAVDQFGDTVTYVDTELSALTHTWSGPSNSPDGTAPDYPASLTFVGGVANASVTLYNAETLTAGTFELDSDGASPKHGENAGSIAVVTTPVATTTIKTVDTLTTAADTVTDAECPHSGATNANDISCPEVFGFFWDQYENNVGGAAYSCDWTFATTVALDGELAGPAPDPGILTTAHNLTVGHTDFIDGALRCTHTASAVFADLTLHGGLAYIEIDHDYNDVGAPIIAALGNINISEVRLFRYVAGTASLLTTALVSEQIDIAETAPTSTLTDIGYAAGNTTCDFTDAANKGKCITNLPFDFTKHESSEDDASPINADNTNGNFDLTISVRGKSKVISSIDVRPGAAVTLAVLTPVSQIAGTPFSQVIEVKDAFGSLTDGYGSAKDCTTNGNELATTVSDAGTSPGMHAGVVSAPSLPSDIFQSGMGTYTTGNITLYKKGVANQGLNFTACGLVAVENDYTVGPAVAGTVYYNNVNASTEPLDVPSPSLAELACTSSGTAANNDSTCSQIWAFMYDAYGNLLDDLTCDSWGYAKIIGDGGDADLANDTHVFSSPGSTQNITFASTDWFNGNLTCSKDAVTTTPINVFGGVAYIELVTDYLEGSDPLIAGTDNLNVTEIRAFRYRGAGDAGGAGVNFELKADAGSAEQVGVASSSTLTNTQLGYATNSTNCDFSTGTFEGKCVTPIPFDFTKHESNEDDVGPADYNNAAGNKSLTLTLRGKSASLTGIDIRPAAASALSVLTPVDQVAGVNFTQQIQVVDAFSNLTDGYGTGTDCTTGGNELAITLADAASSPGGHEGSITAPSLPPDISQDTIGHYTTNNIALYKKGVANQGLNFTACGLVAVENDYTVAPAVANALYYSTDDNPATPNGLNPAPDFPELQCVNSFVAGSGDTNCSTIYAHLWDAFGNILDDQTCDWTYVNESGNGTPAGFPANGQHSITILHNSYLDGGLTCAKNAATESVVIFGGVSAVAISYLDNADAPGSDPLNTLADTDALQITQIQAYQRKNNAQISNDNITGSGSLLITTDYSLGAAGLGPANPFSCTFNATGLCDKTGTPIDFALTSAESGKFITFNLYGIDFTIATLNVGSNAANTLIADDPGAQTAGAGFDITATVYDVHGNQVDQVCGDITIANFPGATSNNSPGGHGGATLGPALPAPVTQDANGHYTLSAANQVTAYKEGVNNFIFSVPSCGGLTDTLAVSVAESPHTTIYINNSDSDPGDGNHLANENCESGSTVNCPTAAENFYAFAWDAYGNDVNDDAFSCAWDILTNNNLSPFDVPAPTVVTASGHSTKVTNSTWHIDAVMRCQAGAITATTNLNTSKIDKGYTWSCGSWACSNTTTAQGTCTATNNSGYDIDSLTFNGEAGATTLVTSACNSGIADGNGCPIIVNTTDLGTGGSGNLSALATVTGHSSFVNLANPAAAAVQGGAIAPSNCSNTLADSVSAWSCNNGSGELTIQLDNNNSIEDATFTSASFSPVGGYFIQGSLCTGTLNDGANCIDTIQNPNAEETTTLTYSFSDGFFQDKGVVLSSSPQCSRESVIDSVNIIENCVGGRKTLEFTVLNQNTIENLIFSTLSGNYDTNVGGNCEGQTISSGGSNTCTFQVAFDPAPAINDISMTLLSTDGYFNNLNIGTGDADNSCP